MSAWVVLLAGCDLVFSLDPPTPPICPAFGNTITELTEFSGGDVEFDPSVSAGELELWFTLERDQSIYSARRDAIGAPFGARQLAPFNDSSANDVDPAVTVDGLRLVFKSTRAGDGVFEVRRTSVEQPFGMASMTLGLANVGGLDISGDGLAVYFADGNDQLFRSSRPSLQGFFDAPEPLGLTGRFPSIGTGELELYFATDAGIRRSTRASQSEPFGESELVNPIGTDPEISPDGQTLYLAHSASLWTMTRVCE